MERIAVVGAGLIGRAEGGIARKLIVHVFHARKRDGTAGGGEGE